MPDSVAALYLAESRTGLRAIKSQADKAIAQLESEQLFESFGGDSNSIAVIMRHMAGNMRSRWTDFLTTDGEKPDRNRDGEFEDPDSRDREVLLGNWESGWTVAFAGVDALTPLDLEKTITIRNEPHSVIGAIERTMRHLSQHVGQIVFIAKDLRGAEWHTLSIPKKRN